MTTDTPAAILRAAVTRLREAAEAASWESPWQVSRNDDTQVWDRGERLVASAEGLAEAAYIALVDPVVGAKLADLLEEATEHLEVDLTDPDLCPCGAAVEGLSCSLLSGALSLARSILGETGGDE